MAFRASPFVLCFVEIKAKGLMFSVSALSDAGIILPRAPPAVGVHHELIPVWSLLCLKHCRVRDREEGNGLKKCLLSACFGVSWAEGLSPDPLHASWRG